jgi:hypothetical protein
MTLNEDGDLGGTIVMRQSKAMIAALNQYFAILVRAHKRRCHR